MKKTAKSVLLLTIMAMLLLALTGCGESKLVATRSHSSDDENDSMAAFLGSFEETIEITFKNKKADKVTWTFELEDEDKAKTVAEVYKSAAEEDEDMSGMEVKQDGKKVIMTMDSKALKEISGVENDDTSKETIKKDLEEDGYKVK